MKHRLNLISMIVLLVLALQAVPVQADGIIIPPRPCEGRGCPPPFPRPMMPLNIRYHHVTVQIADQLATTHVDQVFSNPNDVPIEGTYIFPLPVDAAVQHFTLWVDGQPVEGKVLTAEEARRVYEDTVQNLRDPALLEYIGRGAVQASVFPIPAGGERRIELEYSQVLTAQNGLIHYVYPLNTEKFSRQPLESVSVKVDVRTAQPVRAVYSPSHQIDITRRDDQNFSASYEAAQVTPQTDFELYYSIGENQAAHLISYRDPGDPVDPDGFFMLLLAPGQGQAAQTVAKDILLVLDRSGSMEGEKFQQAQAALRYILQHLNPEDRFHLTVFSSDIQMYASQLRPASEAPAALDWVNSLAAAGSTDINRALLEAAAVADRERPTYLIFLTDGLPTEGVTDSSLILNNFQENAPRNLRLFSFGVGYDVDTFLLDTLSQEHHGLSSYVQPGQSLDENLSAFYARISSPVLTDVKLDFGDLQVYDVYPQPLPDLFSGSQVVITGRYRQGASVEVRLQGQGSTGAQTYRFPELNFVSDSRAIRNAPVQLPRLWATRKIGYLLNEIRLKGPNKEIITQVVQLSIRYGVVTPYTSYLVTEPMPLGATSQEQIVQNTLNNMATQPAQPAFGQGAVQKAAREGAMAQAEAPAPISASDSQLVRLVGSRTFVLNEKVWTDTRFDPAVMKAVPVAFLSADYFTLAGSDPELAAALALDANVIVVSDGKAYQVVSSDQPVPTLAPEIIRTPVPDDHTATPVTISATPNPERIATLPVTLPPAAGSNRTGLLLAGIGGLALLCVVLWRMRRR